jgi:uncharacterized protein (TIGR00661 family)
MQLLCWLPDVKIIYGVQSQGQGHLNRAAAVVAELRIRGHHVEVVSSGQPMPAYARTSLAPWLHIDAPMFTFVDGRLQTIQTLRNMAKVMPVLWRASKELSKHIRRSGTDMVISDFEPVTAWAAKHAAVPAYGVAGQYRITHTDAKQPGSASDRLLAHAMVAACAPSLRHRFAVSFAPLRVTAKNTTVIGPLVGPDIATAATTTGEHILVYNYGLSFADLLAQLPSHYRYIVYGLGVQLPTANVTFEATDRRNFVRDLASCRTVVAHGSFQLACEAAMLGKPLLSIALAGQYEEQFSAHQVLTSGLGLVATRIDRAAIDAIACHPPLSTPPASGMPALMKALSL